jgi:hypothetical protein
MHWKFIRLYVIFYNTVIIKEYVGLCLLAVSAFQKAFSRKEFIMSKADKQEKKAAKKAAKAEKKANKQPQNPEIVKSVISAVTALLCVVAIVLTGTNITNKICQTNLDIAEKYPANSNNASSGDVTGGSDVDPGAADPSDPGAADPANPADPGATDPSAPADNNSGSTDNKGTATDKKATDGAPVGSDIAKIVAYYNAAANATKANKGKMTLDIVQGSTTKITETSFPNGIKNIGNKLLPNDYGTKKHLTVTNGNAVGTKTTVKGETKNENKSINKILPIDNNPKMSTLTAAGVKSATCTKVSGGYKVVIKLKSETVTSLSEKPKNHYSCMDVLNISEDDLGGFKIEDCKIQYTGGTLTATVNDKNMLTHFDVVNPMHITGNLTYPPLIKGSAVIDASWKQTVTFKY